MLTKCQNCGNTLTNEKGERLESAYADSSLPSRGLEKTVTWLRCETCYYAAQQSCEDARQASRVPSDIKFHGVWPIPKENGGFVAFISWPLDSERTTRWATRNINADKPAYKATVNDIPVSNQMTISEEENDRLLSLAGIAKDDTDRIVGALAKTLGDVGQAFKEKP